MFDETKVTILQEIASEYILHQFTFNCTKKNTSTNSTYMNKFIKHHVHRHLMSYRYHSIVRNRIAKTGLNNSMSVEFRVSLSYVAETAGPYLTGLMTEETDPCVKELNVTYCHIFIKTNNIIKKKTSKVQKCLERISYWTVELRN